jgi:hypothetical protein
MFVFNTQYKESNIKISHILSEFLDQTWSFIRHGNTERIDKFNRLGPIFIYR